MRNLLVGQFPKTSLTAFIIALIVAGRAAVGIVMPSAAAGPRQSFPPNFGASSAVVIVSPTSAAHAAGGAMPIEAVPPAATWPTLPPTSEVGNTTTTAPAPQRAL